MNRKILITGGSGFIGTNVVESLLASGYEVLNVDIHEPQNPDHHKFFNHVDILDRLTLAKTFQSFAPTEVIHLAARADLHETKYLEGYQANIKGVENLVHAISLQPSVTRTIFISTKLVCPTDYTPRSDGDYCPTTLYGKSKVIGEKIVKDSTTLQCDWCIVRPTSIWGPWSLLPHIPYGRFFQMIANGRYFHPGSVNPPKSFGYVGNTVFQIEQLLDASREQIHRQTFYLSDYEVFTIKEWADVISLKLRNKRIRTIPEPAVLLLAWIGDGLKHCGIKEPPFSSFRLKNMRANTAGVPIQSLQAITGPLPFSMEQGVEQTISWLKKYQLL